ncbi:lipopolysaccharide export system permease protein [Dysgonomonas macrotermitis]|uniref:Lipopolysaccharide export system permease protein n=2 Tax=Dysgonomonas macrotermitis TaxID=1346286 RepID=A0A1M5E0S0_9BACT|nr:LptF/LptG family permease [Dysgonomonas macrotermitis]SHF72847.1 lipopolysaccharide export system permease protein [Dysgonomonas macrotermitis]
MLRIKRLYLYILQSFVPVFFMTFAISLFIILMQFLWKYVEDLVGKGLEVHVLTELFLYAALTLVPMALPLAILLASLMTFGNLGERFELTAIKAAGISLLRAMRPLIILITAISIGAFYFQNDVIPKVNVKFRTLMISIKQKSPELDIPENTFYSDIENYNLFVKEKDKETGMLRDVMIYDVSKGFDNMAVIVCDSAKMKMSSHKDYLMLTLFYGQQFSNLKQTGFRDNISSSSQFVPYTREIFKEKKVIIPFDANFNRIDESAMEGTQLAKNITQLRSSIDSLSLIVDSLNITDRKIMVTRAYVSTRNIIPASDSLSDKSKVRQMSLDSILTSFSAQEKQRVYSSAASASENGKNDMMFRSFIKIDLQKKIRGHNVELQRKFTLSFACLVFFFIGAPLGAIIRKGGLGMPVVVSVILFIIYYIIDNVGYKMARDGVWPVWQGVWLSSFILFPLGAFITYKAINDSALFNADAYRNYYIRFFGDRTAMSMEQLYIAYNRNVRYGLITFAICIVLVVLSSLTGGFLGGLFTVFTWISGIAYIILFIQFFLERYEFYKRAKQESEISIKEMVFTFTIGVFFYFVLYLYYRNKMAKMLGDSESGQKAVLNI